MQRPHPNHLYMLALSGFLLVPALAFLGLRLETGFANDRLQPGTDSITTAGLIVTPVDGPPAGLQPGDLVTHVDGRHLETWAQGLFTVERFSKLVLRAEALSAVEGGAEGSFAGVARPQWEPGETVRYGLIRNGQPFEVEVTLGRYPLGRIAQRNWGTIVFALAFFTLAAYVLARRPQTPAAYPLFLSASAVLSATTWSLGIQVSDLVNGAGFWLFQFTTIVAFMMFWIAGVHFALIFPRPLPVARRRWLLPAVYVAPYLLLFFYLLVTYQESRITYHVIEAGPNVTLAWIRLWGPTTGLHGAVFMMLMLLAVVWQYRTHRRGVVRQQLRWLTWAVVVSGGSGLVLYLLPPLLGRPALDANVMGVIILTFPVALVVAILRHNLFDIDTLLNRTMVYGALTAVTITIYVLVVSVLGAMFRARGDWFVALVATGAVAVLFQPLRERLQRWANRLIYGERDEPFEVLTRLGRRLEETLSPEAALFTIVETVAQALKLPYVAMTLPQEPGHAQENGQNNVERFSKSFIRAVSYGKPVAHAVSYPLLYQGETLGQLLAAPRAAGEPFTEGEDRLLRSIARQAGTAVHAVRLTADLQRSRQRLVTTREEERRRLRRDLHDGLGPQLASQTLGLDALEKLLDKNPAAARELLRALRSQAQEAISDVRRLVYDLRPPSLDELGLVDALRESASRYEAASLRFTFDVPETLPELPAAVEVAAFRIIQEAMINVVRHAQASHCAIKLAIKNGALVAEVADNGSGLPAGGRSGVGLQSMRERAAELNGRCIIEASPEGGTLVRAEVPLA